MPIDGVDTSIDLIPPGSASAPAFFCLTGEETRGPFDLIELAGQLRCSTINPETLIWREGDEQRLALREIPEFATVQEMPIETIARHLEEKERGEKKHVRPQGRSWFSNSTSLLAAVLIVAAILAICISMEPVGSRSAMSVPVQLPMAWQTTDDNGFSVECPIRLQLAIPPPVPGVSSYRANVSGAGFGVDMQFVPGTYSAAEYENIFDMARDKVVDGLLGRVISDTPIMVNGSHGRLVFFSQYYGGKKLGGGLCVLGGRGKLAMAWAVAHSNQVGYDEIKRYLNSFEIH